MCSIICSSFTFIALHVHVYLKSTLYCILVSISYFQNQHNNLSIAKRYIYRYLDNNIKLTSSLTFSCLPSMIFTDVDYCYGIFSNLYSLCWRFQCGNKVGRVARRHITKVNMATLKPSGNRRDSPTWLSNVSSAWIKIRKSVRLFQL